MPEFSNDQATVMIALLAQLVAATAKDDPVLVLTKAGVGQAEVARLLGMNLSTVSMRVSRAATKPRAKVKARSAPKGRANAKSR